MKKILAALAILAVIAAGTATAVFQQTRPEEYATVELAVNSCKDSDESIYQDLGVGSDHIVVLYNQEHDAYRFMDIRQTEDGYIVKKETALFSASTPFSINIQYSKKETAVVSLTPDESGKMQCSLSLESK